MIELNYNNLDRETQQFLITTSKATIEKKYCDSLKKFAAKNQLDYKRLLEEEAIRNLYNYKFKFSL